MAMVPRRFFRPLAASLRIGARVGFCPHVSGHAAALDHELGDDAMKDGAVEKAVRHVFEKIGDGERSHIGGQFQGDGPEAGFHADDGIGLFHGYAPVGRRAFAHDDVEQVSDLGPAGCWRPAGREWFRAGCITCPPPFCKARSERPAV